MTERVESRDAYPLRKRHLVIEEPEMTEESGEVEEVSREEPTNAVAIALPQIQEAPCGVSFEEELRKLIEEGQKYIERIMELESGDVVKDRKDVRIFVECKGISMVST